jgi:hypothetical protein
MAMHSVVPADLSIQKDRKKCASSQSAQERTNKPELLDERGSAETQSASPLGPQKFFFFIFSFHFGSGPAKGEAILHIPHRRHALA